jgi:hypothetical protein
MNRKTVRIVQKSNRKIVETEAKSISLAHNVHDRLLSWLGTGISTNVVVLNQLYGSKPHLLVKLHELTLAKIIKP